MRIIKHGKLKRQITCNYCGCEYEFDIEDTYTDTRGYVTTTGFWNNNRYVNCPECSLKTLIFPNQTGANGFISVTDAVPLTYCNSKQ